MSQSPRDLMRQLGAPAPRAATVMTEVRTEGIIKFGTVTAPGHQSGVTFGSLYEWRAKLSAHALDGLRAFLTKGSPAPEALIDNWLKQSGMGAFVGVFIQTGSGGNVVRALFAYTKPQLGAEEINQAWAQLVEKPKTAEKKASAAIRQLRTIFVGGEGFTEAGMLTLSTLDYAAVMGDRGSKPFQSIDADVK